jgi:Domain of unknown function (DUF4189)
MTGDADFSLEALFGPGGDPDRRERLAALLSDGLADEQYVQPPDIAEIAAYLDQGLSESERQAVQQNLSKSAVARADMESAADLLEIVQNSTERPSGAVMHQAANVMMAAAAQLRHEHGYRTVAAAGERSGPQSPIVPAAAHQHPRTFWQRLSGQRVQIGLGFAFASLIAFLVWNAQTGLTTVQAPPDTPNGHPYGSQQAITSTNEHLPAVAAPFSQSWGAIAVSSEGNAYGISHGATTEKMARTAAMTDCIARHGLNCRVTVAGQGQCFALAGRAEGMPSTAAAESYDDAQRRAIAACRAARGNAAVCNIDEAFCSGR